MKVIYASLIMIAIGLSACGEAPSSHPTFLSRKANSLVEATSYYNTINAPATLAEWKTQWGFDSGDTASAQYFNKLDLALGRGMHCKQTTVFKLPRAPLQGVVHVDEANAGQPKFISNPDGNPPKPPELPDIPTKPELHKPTINKLPLFGVTRIACYVTNFGSPGGEQADAFAALDAHQPGATVAMDYESDRTENKVRFYIYDAAENISNDVALDSEGPKVNPSVCLNCHGSSFTTGSNTISDATFLPFEPSTFGFDATHTNNEEQFRILNSLIMKTEPSQGVQDLVNGLYASGSVNTSGTVAGANYIPASWQGSGDQEKLYSKYARPYCIACHMSQTSYPFASYAEFTGASAIIENDVCASHSMPHAEVPYKNIWGDGEFLGGLKIQEFQTLLGISGC